MTIARVKLIFSLFIFLRECEVIEGILPYGTHSLFSKDLLNFSREKTPPSRNSWSEVNRGVEASDPSASSTSENVMFDGTSWDGGQHFASYLEPSINFNPVDDKYHHTEMAIEASIQLPPYFSGNDLFEGTGWDGKQSFASLLEPDNLWSTPPSQNHGIGDPVSLEHSQTTAILSPEPNFVQPTTVKSLKSERPNILEVSHNSRLLRAVKTNASKKQNIPLNQKNSDKSFQVKNGEVKSITGVSQSGAHSLFSNDLLNFSGERIPPYEKSLREIGRRVDASDRKSSSKSENDLFEGTAGWDGLQPFFPFSESSANFIPLSDRYHHTLAEMGSLNQQITNFSKNDVFEGIGWDGEQSLTSMLEPEYSQNMVFSQNHHILSSNNLNYAVPLEQSREQPSFDQPLSDESFEVVRPIILESSRNNDSLRTIIKKSFKKRKTRVKNTKNQRFSSSWWNNIYLPDVINSLNEVEDIKLEFQIFLDIMDKLADDLISSKKDDYIRMNMNVDHDGLQKLLISSYHSSRLWNHRDEKMDLFISVMTMFTRSS
ncbi:hypothetical protein BY996DRAFT_7853767 [Phakopsora pachyrhizi]|nr:hypothetical protein BY996DRAFT_7853767 [Phakopsora pachyrhizi]